MTPRCRLLPRTLSSHRKNAHWDHCYERAGCMAARPHLDPKGAAERPRIRASGHLSGTNTFPVHQQHEATLGSPSCSLVARVVSRRVDPTAARALPSPVSLTRPRVSACIPREAYTPRPQALYMRWHPPAVQRHTGRGLPRAEIPPRTVCGSGLSPDPADSLSHSRASSYRASRRKFRRPVAGSRHASGGKITQSIPFHPETPLVLEPAYVWQIPHAKWNLLRRIEHGNTSATPKKWLVP